jgi:hypothetical protein
MALAGSRNRIGAAVVFGAAGLLSGCGGEDSLNPADSGCSEATAATYELRSPWTSCERAGDWTIVWTSDEWCYQGYGFLKPEGADPGAEAITAALRARGVPSSYVDVKRRVDGWYELCFTT